MAKSKSFFGLRTGSTKSLTFQVYRGQQITKDRVYRVANPRTEAQMKQRALIPIVAAARSALKGLVDHSFEGVQYGEASLKEFSALNLRAGALEVTSYSPIGYSNPGFANLIVSKGSINEPYDLSVDSDGFTVSLPGTYPKMKFPAAPEDGSSKQVWKDLETWARANKVSLLKPGTQLTFLTMYEGKPVNVSTGSGIREVPTSAFNICRMYIPNGDSDSVYATDINDEWKIDKSVSTSSDEVALINRNGDKLRIETNVDPLADGSAGSVEIIVTPAEAAEEQNWNGMALILSRNENGVWKRNTSRFEIILQPENVFTLADYVNSYAQSQAQSRKYLNTGDESTGING
jgi:hypothetical protein